MSVIPLLSLELLYSVVEGGTPKTFESLRDDGLMNTERETFYFEVVFKILRYVGF